MHLSIPLKLCIPTMDRCNLTEIFVHQLYRHGFSTCQQPCWLSKCSIYFRHGVLVTLQSRSFSNPVHENHEKFSNQVSMQFIFLIWLYLLFFFLKKQYKPAQTKTNTSAKYHSSQHYDQYQAQHLTSCKSRLYFGHILHVDTVQYNQSSCKLESMILSIQLRRHGHNFCL